MEFINGKPLFQPKMGKDERNDAINTLVKLQCMVHKVQAIDQSKQIDKMLWKIKQTSHISEAQRNQLLLSLERLDTNCDNLCHGDIHPLNILYDGNKHWIIDWVDSSAGNPLADACRTYLIFKQFMTRQAGLYLRAFCKEANVKFEDVLIWLPIVTATRLNENMDDKSRAWLMNILEQNS